MKNSKKILLVSPRGFCAGVTRAIEIVELALQKYGSPVYVNPVSYTHLRAHET